MNAPLLPEILRRDSPSAQGDLPLAAEGIQRFVWEGRWGPMLIEVRGERIFVNGDRVERFEPRASEDGVSAPLKDTAHSSS